MSCVNNSVTDDYIIELVKKSNKYEKFDEQGLQEFDPIDSETEKGKIIMSKISSPKLILKLENYKLQERVKSWKPDTRIFYFRSDWHRKEMGKIRMNN